MRPQGRRNYRGNNLLPRVIVSNTCERGRHRQLSLSCPTDAISVEELLEVGAQRVCFYSCVFGRCGAFIEALSFVEERCETVGQCPNEAERVSLTRSCARTELPGHTDAIDGKYVSNYPT